MNTTKTSNGLKVKSALKSAGLGVGNHNRKLSSGLKVKSALKSAGLGVGNHNRDLAAV